MNETMVWRRHAVDALFVATESVAWFMAIRVFATMLEQTFYEDLERRLDVALRGDSLLNPQRGEQVLELVRASVEQPHGPSLLLVLLVGFGAFYLIRLVEHARLGNALGAIVLLMGSVVALNLLLRLALAGDVRVWDLGSFTGFFGNPDAYFAARVDLNAFIARPSFQSAHGGALSITFALMVAMWIRYLLAGRAHVNFERVLRSFGASFFAVLLILVAARLGDVAPEARFAVLHFVLGVLGLAVANNARAATPAEGARRTTPWLASVGATVGILAAVALVLGFLAAINVGVVLVAIGNLALAIVEVVLIIIVTPIFWVAEALINRLFPDGIDLFQAEVPEPGEDIPETEQGDGISLPGWGRNVLQILAVVVLTYIGYRIARLIVSMRRAAETAADEIRSRRAEGVGLGELLRDLLPRRGRRGEGGDWMRRHAIYRLYGRTVMAAHQRGFRLLPGETPIEFSGRSARVLDAPFEPVGRAFDRARYGRHYPSTEDVREMQAEVERWESEKPVTEELRQQIRGAPQLSDMAEVQLRVQQNRLRARGDEDAARRIDLG